MENPAIEPRTHETMRKNAGFYITVAIRTSPTIEFVMGVKQKKYETEYVTWMCNNEEDYHHGHYMTDGNKALKDLYERVIKELEFKIEILNFKIKEQTK